ncbi:TonB-dependent receptor [Cellulophaga sp. HaHaR_3_176]|uniref:TonB-dependent receptor n=1 Tax=Cellulophaga sp. HaHaR_3_176 TaxID=1942464 RepID=UPI001C200801|nr:TonB-dependent receptor [Cellulophaga sp. HaHaR_3_176]QWX84640.1 TonB-dependent receptor [Cellulophaga sp. HaHaR_3_176]
MTKKLLNLFFIFGAVFFSYAQTGGVKGLVTDNNGNPLFGVNIIVQNASQGVQTNFDGDFLINNIGAKQQTLKISFLGYKTKELQVNINENEIADIGTLVLLEGTEILQEVVISAERTNKFARKQTAYVSKLPLKDIENTQVYSTITTELLESQVVTNFQDALKNAVGIEQLWTSTGRGGDGAGFYSLRGFSTQPQLVNGVPGLTNGTINAANIERIEVVKGPSATLFGSTVTSYGGLINVVTKKPYKGSGGQLSFTSGTYGLNIITGDFNTPLDKEDNIYFRLNTSYHTEDSFQDTGFSKSFFVAPSLSYQVNNKLSFSFYSEISTSERTNPTMLFLSRGGPIQYADLDELGYNNKLSFTSNALTLKNPTANYRVEMDYKLSDTWNSQTILSKSNTSTDGYYTYLYDLTGEGVFSRFLNKQNASSQTTDFQQNFIGDFKIGNLRNRMVAGVDYYNLTGVDNSSSYVYYGSITPDGNTIEEGFPLTTAGVDGALATANNNNQKTKSHVYSTYVSDVINFTPALSAMASVRLDFFDQEGDVTDTEDDFDQFAVSPKFGLMYQPILEKLSVFGNYQNGFSNISPTLVGDPSEGAQTLKTFRPEQANQLEFGLKTNILNNRFNATVSYYAIQVSDKVMTDPNNAFNKIQDGEIESKGFEIELNANPISGLNIKAGYSNNKSEITESDNPDSIGQRPVEAGPESIYNFWANYNFQNGALEGFGFGAGFNGTSERDVLNIGYAPSGNFVLPGYTIFNASLFYASENYRIGLKLNNAFNKEYYNGWSTITPQQPRALLANFTYKF